jgi:hypothetical protein
MATRFLTNPVFSIETGELLSHEGEFFLEDHEVPIRFDRSIQKGAKGQAASATGVGGQAGATASQIGSTLIPGLEREATNPTGYTPLEKSRMLTAGAEGIGGAGAGAGGASMLEKLRTGSPSGFSSALQEVARQKGRQLSQNALGVENESSNLAQRKQQNAQQMLGNLYGVTSGNQLKAMGLADEDLNTALRAGQSGWLQNVEGGLNTIGNLAGGAAGIKKAWG